MNHLQGPDISSRLREQPTYSNEELLELAVALEDCRETSDLAVSAGAVAADKEGGTITDDMITRLETLIIHNYMSTGTNNSQQVECGRINQTHMTTNQLYREASQGIAKSTTLTIFRTATGIKQDHIRGIGTTGEVTGQLSLAMSTDHRREMPKNLTCF